MDVMAEEVGERRGPPEEYGSAGRSHELSNCRPWPPSVQVRTERRTLPNN
jgi:hypothetical protein